MDSYTALVLRFAVSLPDEPRKEVPRSKKTRGTLLIIICHTLRHYTICLELSLKKVVCASIHHLTRMPPRS